MARFREVIQAQGMIIQETKHEMEQHKLTIQKNAQELNVMKDLLNRQDAMIIEQDLKLNKQDKDVKDLKVSAQKQDKEMRKLKKRILIMKKALITQDSKLRNLFPNSEDNLQEGNIGHEMELNTDLLRKYSFGDVDILDNEPVNNSSDASLLTVNSVNNMKEIFQNLSEDNSLRDMETKAVPNLIPKSDSSSGGFQGHESNTGVAFSAYLGHVVEHMAIGHTIKCDQVLINDRNTYSPYTGTFTVPETAVYFLTFQIDAYNKGDETVVKLVSNNRNIVDAVAWVTGTGHHVMTGNSAIIRLNSGDKVWLEIYNTNSVQLYSLPNYRFVTFSGYKLY